MHGGVVDRHRTLASKETNRRCTRWRFCAAKDYPTTRSNPRVSEKTRGIGESRGTSTNDLRVWARRPHEPSPFYPSRPSSSVRRISRPSSHAPLLPLPRRFSPFCLAGVCALGFHSPSTHQTLQPRSIPASPKICILPPTTKAKVGTFEGLPSSRETSTSKKPNPPFLPPPGPGPRTHSTFTGVEIPRTGITREDQRTPGPRPD
jgi:hypothetical protein